MSKEIISNITKEDDQDGLLDTPWNKELIEEAIELFRKEWEKEKPLEVWLRIGQHPIVEGDGGAEGPLDTLHLYIIHENPDPERNFRYYNLEIEWSDQGNDLPINVKPISLSSLGKSLEEVRELYDIYPETCRRVS